MAGLKELRVRISSITSTQKITSAMKMVAAARLRKSQDMLQKSQAYYKDLSRATGRLLREMQAEEKKGKIVYLRPQVMRPSAQDENYFLVVFSSDKGLCGSYNANILKECLRRIKELISLGKKVKVLSLGKKAGEALKRRCPDVEVEIINDFAAKGPSYSEVKALVKRLIEEFGKDFDVCETVCTYFHSAINREVKTEQFLPLTFETEGDDYTDVVNGAVYEYEQNKQSVLFDLVPMAAESIIFQMLLNAQTSEQGARMTSMDNATRNASDMISKLTLKYNRLRQSAITTELIEIISGAEAL